MSHANAGQGKAPSERLMPPLLAGVAARIEAKASEEDAAEIARKWANFAALLARANKQHGGTKGTLTPSDW